MCVTGRPQQERDTGTEIQSGNRERKEVRVIDGQKSAESAGEGGSEIREDESRMEVRPLGVRGNMLNMYVLFPYVSGLQAVRAISFNCSSLCG